MKKTILLCITALASTFMAYAGDPVYKATIDLTSVKEDKVKVIIKLPEITQNEITYCLPKIVPGTYAIYDFGRFISAFTVYDKNGNKMPFEPIDVNQYKIKNAAQIGRLEYWVDDTFDSELTNPVFEPCGTNIEEGKNFQINTFGFIGYVDGMKGNDYELTVKKPAGFYGSTAMRAVEAASDHDTYFLSDYDHVADAPMLYAPADTAVKKVGGADVLIGVYSPNKKVSADFIMRNVSEILEAQEKYLGGKLPVDKYAFIFYFADSAGVSGSNGALEHNNSSVYYLPEIDSTDLAPFLRDVCAHEFFHIVTPLNIHSKEIGDFDFINPKMSKHLWLYEGQTEYAAHHAQVEAGLITVQEFLDRMDQKIENSQGNFNDTLPFTVMSVNCLEQYKDQYNNVYQKGALINMCLDIELRRLSNGKYGTQQLMKDLAKEYGKDKPFNDAELFDKITALTYPEIREFFRLYVEGDNVIPYEKYFGYAGIKLSPIEYEQKASLGYIPLNYDFRDTTNMIITIGSLEGANEFGRTIGYKQGDRLIGINKFKLTSGDPDQSIENWKHSAKQGDKVTFIVQREVKPGKIKTLKLKGNVLIVDVQKPRTLNVSADATAEQVKLRKAWLGY